MQKLVFLTLIILLTGHQVFGEGIAFFQGSFKEAQDLALKEGKMIFVDAYTTWCGPCKRMSKFIFPLDEVGEFYNQNFINVKLDMENGEGREFQKKYRVFAYPTFLFLNGNGDELYRKIGGMDARNFVLTGKKALLKDNNHTQLQQEYESGNRSSEFIVGYIKSLSKAGKPVISIVNDYIGSQTSMNTTANLTILYYGAEEADSRIFELLMDHRDEVAKLMGTQPLLSRIEEACWATVEKAKMFSVADLVEEAIHKMQIYYPEEGKRFAFRARLSYFAHTENYEEYLKVAKMYAKIGDEEKMELAENINIHLAHNYDLMKWAQKWILEIDKPDHSSGYYYLTAQILYKNGQYDDALDMASKARQFAMQTGSEKQTIELLIKAITDKLGS